MIQTILLGLLGLVALGLGGDWLVRGASGIALRMGISSLVTGIVIVGFATSMPELVASVQAALAGSPGIAWGNIAGSNLANTLLILGAAALVMPIVLTGQGRRDAVVATLASILLSGLAVVGASGPVIGIALLLLIVIYIVWRYRTSRKEGAGRRCRNGRRSAEATDWARRSAFCVVGVVTLVIGGNLLVTSAIDIARIFGMPETVIGLTIVAVGTSLPELAASLVAAWRGHSALALGNVVGSNIYNILLIGGVTMLIAPGADPAGAGRYRIADRGGQRAVRAGPVLVRAAHPALAGRCAGRGLRGIFHRAVRVEAINTRVRVSCGHTAAYRAIVTVQCPTSCGGLGFRSADHLPVPLCPPDPIEG